MSFAFQEGDKDRMGGEGFCIFVFAMNFDFNFCLNKP